MSSTSDLCPLPRNRPVLFLTPSRWRDIIILIMSYPKPNVFAFRFRSGDRVEDSDKKVELEKLPEWADNVKLDIIEAFREYLSHRREELSEALNPGMGLETWDPYLNGFAQGMKTGLEIAEDLCISYSEWVMREVHFPDERSFKWMDR